MSKDQGSHYTAVEDKNWHLSCDVEASCMNTARRLGEEIETAVRLFILYVDGYNHVKVGDKTHCRH